MAKQAPAKNVLVDREVQAIVVPEKPKVLEATLVEMGEQEITVEYDRRGIKVQQIPLHQVVSVTIKEETEDTSFSGKKAIIEYNPPFDTINGILKVQSKQGTVLLRKRGEKESLVLIPKSRILSIKEIGGGSD